MRHFISPSAVANHAGGMFAAAAERALIAPIGLALLGPARLAGTAPSTINLATVAPAADKGLTMTLGAAEETGRDSRLRPLQRDKT
jgi:hypothetical protein